MDPDRHGDADAKPGMTDFAVNVRPGPPGFLAQVLRDSVAGLAAYPRRADEDEARTALGALHGRTADEVLLLNGAEEGFELVAGLPSRHAAVVVPSFTEPVVLLHKAGVRVTEVVGTPPWRLADVYRDIPADADLVVVGNPTNPTSVRHPADDVLALRAPGRLLVVDEAFADLGGGSVAGCGLDDVVVLRSMTKTFGLAGLRAGYLIAAPGVIADLSRRRRAWPVDTPTLAALTACAGAAGQAYVAEQAAEVAAERDYLCRTLRDAGFSLPVEPDAPFVLARHPGAPAIREGLARRGIAVRSAENFTGLSAEYLRFAVRPRALVDDLSQALESVLEEIA
ncbi:Rv2231c family pyridoxal phosphate-dependent protein CobC [Gordonia crocea]|nr:Rv2231c family pyridoxal phosphate-dependent protein CobC [Gordonia crocea]